MKRADDPDLAIQGCGVTGGLTRILAPYAPPIPKHNQTGTSSCLPRKPSTSALRSQWLESRGRVTWYALFALVVFHTTIGGNETIAANARRPVPRVSPERLAEFRRQFNVSELTIGEYGAPCIVKGDLGGTGDSLPLREVAFRFFEQSRDVYGLHDPRSELRVSDSSRTPFTPGTFMKFRQHVDGIPVYGSVMTALFSEDGNLTRVTGDYRSDIPRSATPLLNESAVESIALRDTATVGSSAKVTSSELLFFNPSWRGDTIILVWHLVVSASLSRSFNYHIDAMTGEIISRTRREKFIDSTLPADSSGMEDSGEPQAAPPPAQTHRMGQPGSAGMQ